MIIKRSFTGKRILQPEKHLSNFQFGRGAMIIYPVINTMNKLERDANKMI